MPYNTTDTAWSITTPVTVDPWIYTNGNIVIENCTVTPRYDGEGTALTGNVTFQNCNIVNGIYDNNYAHNYVATNSIIYENSTIANSIPVNYVATTPNSNYETGIDQGTGDHYVGTQGIYNTGTGIIYNIVSNDFWESAVTASPEEIKTRMKKERLKSNLVIQIKSRAELPRAIPDNERIAMETLREVISETEFRKYIKYGFIMVKGQSGDNYQIFRNRSHTKVWRAGKVIEEVCVRIKYEQGVPPTDNVIAFRTIIQTDELAFKKLGNVYKMNGRTQTPLHIFGGVAQQEVARAA